MLIGQKGKGELSDKMLSFGEYICLALGVLSNRETGIT